MASTLTSNSFLLTTPPRSNLTKKNSRSRLTVSAEAFRLGKQDDNSSSNEKPNKFFIDFGKTSNVKSLIPVVSRPGFSFGGLRSKDAKTVFVAGATGQAGVRIAQTLLREGFTVRAGVPELLAAQELAQFAAAYKIISPEESKRLVAIESTFGDVESIAKTMGNASKVVVTIGPTEDGPTSPVTTDDALQVIKASQLAGVSHVAIIYDDSSISASSDYNIITGITSFFNNLFDKNQSLTITEFLESIVQTDVRFTLIKTSLTEDFGQESSYNIVVSAEGSTEFLLSSRVLAPKQAHTEQPDHHLGFLFLQRSMEEDTNSNNSSINGNLETSRSDRSVWLMKCPLVVAKSLQAHASDPHPVAKVVLSVDPLQADDPSSLQFMMELAAPEGNMPKNYSLNMFKDFVPMCVFSEGNQGKVSTEGKVEHKFDMKPHNDNIEEYGKLCRERTNKSMIKNRQIQRIDNDRGAHMRPMPGSVALIASTSKDKKKMAPTKGSDMKRTRRDRGELEDVMFKLFERQPNWTLKQLVQETDQPAQFLKEILNELCVYNKRGTNQGTYELKPEYKKSVEDADA